MKVNTTRAALAAALNEWAKRCLKEPTAFGSYGEADYGERSADYLIGLLAEQKGE